MGKTRILRKSVSNFREFLQSQVATANPVLFAAILALGWKNYAPSGYEHFWNGQLFGGLTLALFVNEVLMVLYFFVIGLEMRREFSTGHLSHREDRTLPVLAALGGMIAPALLFFAFCRAKPESAGWAIPTATDIVFSLAILTALGRKIPLSLKTFMTALAVIDDLLAMILIAVFYSNGLAFGVLAASFVLVVCLYTLGKMSAKSLPVILIGGVVLAVFFYLAGLHPTLAGVVVAWLIPDKESTPGAEDSVLNDLEHKLVPYTSLIVLPIFALSAAGVYLSGSLAGALPLGILAGLVLGKPLGITLATFLGTRAKWGRLPVGANWGQLVGTAALGGIGFTISTFIAGLAFEGNVALLNTAKMAVLAASLLASAIGATALVISSARTQTFVAANDTQEERILLSTEEESEDPAQIDPPTLP